MSCGRAGAGVTTGTAGVTGPTCTNGAYGAPESGKVRAVPMVNQGVQALDALSLDPSAPPGYRSYWRGEYLPELSDAAIDAFLPAAVELTAVDAPLSQVIVFRVGQGVAAVAEGATAFSHRDVRYLFHPISMWLDPGDDEAVIARNRALTAAMRPFTTGASYLNFTPEADRVRDAFGQEKYARLVAIKDVYDPGNFFRLNQNIRPSRAAALA